MSKCTRRNLDFLKTVLKSKSVKRKNLLLNATKDNIHCLSEIAHNTCKGNIPYKRTALKRLKKFKLHVRRLAKKRLPFSRKKRILLQHGGFLPLLIEPVIAALVGTVAKIQIEKL